MDVLYVCVSEDNEPSDRNAMTVLLLYAFVHTNNLFYTSAHVVR